MKNSIVTIALAFACTACHVNGDVLLGKDNSGRAETAISVPCFEYALDTTQSVDQSTATCTVPKDSVLSVVPEIDGQLSIWVKKLADGRYPTITYLGFQITKGSDVGIEDSVYPMNCTPGSLSADGLTQQVKCKGPHSRISSVRNDSRDSILTATALTLLNAGCGAAITYAIRERQYTCSYESYESWDRTREARSGSYKPIPMGGPSFPFLYLSESSTRLLVEPTE